MGKLKEYYFEVLTAESECKCPPFVNHAEELCPCCQNELGEWLEENHQDYPEVA